MPRGRGAHHRLCSLMLPNRLPNQSPPFQLLFSDLFAEASASQQSPLFLISGFLTLRASRTTPFLPSAAFLGLTVRVLLLLAAWLTTAFLQFCSLRLGTLKDAV